MIIIRDPEVAGFVPRLIRVYREKRQPQQSREYAGPRGTVTQPILRRMPRRAAFQIAWHQARNAQGLGTQE